MKRRWIQIARYALPHTSGFLMVFILLGYSYKRPSKTIPLTALMREEKIGSIKKILNPIDVINKDKDSVIYALDESYFSTELYFSLGCPKRYETFPSF